MLNNDEHMAINSKQVTKARQRIFTQANLVTLCSLDWIGGISFL
jgi:hypothetical protein